MIAYLLDGVMRAFERRTASPALLQPVARLVESVVQGSKLNARLVARIQSLRLVQLIRYVSRHSPYYRTVLQKFDQASERFRTPADLKQLPFTASRDIRDWSRFLCVPENRLAAVFTTSGTTGEPKRVFFTFRELTLLTNWAAIALRFRHPGRLVALIAMPLQHGLWIGSATAQRVIERAGGLPIPVGTEEPADTLKWMERFEPNVVISSPSYMTALTRHATRTGYRRRLDRVLLSGETLTADQKQTLTEYWSAQVLDSYGSTEIGGGQTLALPDCTAFHLNDLHLVTEIVDPETGQPADEGELVFTTLLREAMPLVRYRSGDRGRWSTCSCGLPFRAVQIGGRTDDMFVAGDMNLYGNIIANAVAGVSGASGRLAILLDKAELTDRLRLRVEGHNVEVDQVKQALFAAYPELRPNIGNGNLLLDIEPNVTLESQQKALKIVDARSKLSAEGPPSHPEPSQSHGLRG